MSAYSNFHHRWISSVDNLKSLSTVLSLLKNAYQLRKKPVESHIGNKEDNIHMADQMINMAEKSYNTHVQELEVMSIVPLDWIPTFEKFKEIAEQSDERDV